MASALLGGEWSASRPGLDDVERRKLLPLLGLELRPSAVQPVASPYTDCIDEKIILKCILMK
jgi:hypothetical protein